MKYSNAGTVLFAKHNARELKQAFNGATAGNIKKYQWEGGNRPPVYQQHSRRPLSGDRMPHVSSGSSFAVMAGSTSPVIKNTLFHFERVGYEHEKNTLFHGHRAFNLFPDVLFGTGR
jgi:hypothetical protein